jgi:hypothetical protein
MAGHFTSYETRTNHELATQTPPELALVPHAVNFDPIFADHAANGFPVLVHLNGFAMVRLK